MKSILNLSLVPALTGIAAIAVFFLAGAITAEPGYAASAKDNVPVGRKPVAIIDGQYPASYFPNTELLGAGEMRITALGTGMPNQTRAAVSISYLVELPVPMTSEQEQALTDFLAADSCLVEKIRKGVSKQIDIRPMVAQLEVQSPSQLRIQTINTATKAGVKPAEALSHLLSLDEDQVNSLKILKTEWLPLDQDGQ